MTTRDNLLFWPLIAVLFFAVLWLLKTMLLPFVLGLGVAYLLDPLVDRLEKAGLGRTLSTSLVLSVFAALFAAVIVFTFPILQDQFLQFAQALPGYIQRARDAVMPLVERVHEKLLTNQGADLKDQASGYAAQALGWASILAAKLWNGGLAVFDILSIIVVAPVVSFYMLRDWDVMVAKVDGWLPRRQAPVIRRLARQMNDALSGFVRGQAIVCVVLGLMYGVGLTFAGLNFGFFIGFMAGLLSFIPYVGSIIGLITGLLVAWFQFDGEAARVLAVAAIFGVGQFIEGNILTPKLVGEKVGLHAVWILFALMAGGTLMGFTGVMIAVPVAALIGVLARFLVGEYLKSSYYTGKPAKGAAS